MRTISIVISALIVSGANVAAYDTNTPTSEPQSNP